MEFSLRKGWVPARAARRAAAAFVRKLRDRTWSRAARWHRRRLSDVTFIGITGSAGKTTTKELLFGILSAKGACAKSFGTGNEHRDVERAVLETTRRHRFSIVEVSAGCPGYLDRSLQAVRPSIGVLTIIAREHYSAFRSLEAIAAEKEKLIRALPANGVAVLNRDDPLVRAIGARFDGRIVWVGRDDGATLRLLEAHSCWPEALVLDVVFEGRRHRVRTALHGVHLALPVLSALGAAVAAGVGLQEALVALAFLEPMQARMQIETTADGVVFVRDDWKAPQWSFEHPLEFMRSARADRKVVVVGSISDSPKSPRDRYARAARQALEVADLVVLVGLPAVNVVKRVCVPPGRMLKAHSSVREAADYLRGELRAGDLVLLKGTNTQDHLVRLVLDREQPVQCWAAACGMNRFCGSCARLHAQQPAIAASQVLSSSPACARPGYPAPIVVGVGNPGPAYVGTRHNVGQRMLDVLAEDAGATWHESAEGFAAVVQLDGRTMTFYKPGSYVNDTGPALQRFLRSADRSATECIVVLDDTDLPSGSVRSRPGGGDGGHKGMRSIIAAVGSESVRRVRVGVRPPTSTSAAKAFVLTAFEAGEEEGLKRAAPLVAQALVEATLAIGVAGTSDR